MWLKDKYDFHKQNQTPYGTQTIDDMFDIVKIITSPLKLIGIAILYIPQIFVISIIYKLVSSRTMNYFGQEVGIALLTIFILITALLMALNKLTDVQIGVEQILKGIAFWFLHPVKSFVYIIDFVFLAVPYEIFSVIKHTLTRTKR